ncbi:AAA family ATPase [Puniceicoccaceae bacterium K14]|nr:AAA family ATPase [Puniceicoccaceae bacterium K14]
MSDFLTAPKNQSTKRIFVAGTRMNDGKTTTCLGLFAALLQQYGSVGFIKPVGQRFVKIGGQLIDEDSVLLDKIFNVNAPIDSMSPIAIDGTFTRRYLENPEQTLQKLTDKVCRAFDRASFGMDFTLIEGSGHAGVGSVFDMSNARVAKILNAKAIIVSRGGIGQPLDEIAMNKALFDKEGVEVIGAIINKVQIDKIDLVRKYTTLGLKKLGIPLLGLLPERKVLTSPNLLQVADKIKGEWLNGKNESGTRRINKIIIGAMTATSILDSVAPGTLLITPGDREDIIMAVLSFSASRGDNSVAGIVLTRGIVPHPRLREMIGESSIPIIIAKDDSYTVASNIHSMTVKTQPQDEDKIPVIKKLTQENLDLDLLHKSMQ